LPNTGNDRDPVQQGSPAGGKILIGQTMIAQFVPAALTSKLPLRRCSLPAICQAFLYTMLAEKVLFI